MGIESGSLIVDESDVVDSLWGDAFETHIAIDKNLRNTWLGLLPLAHTIVIYALHPITTTSQNKPPQKTDIAKLSRQELLEMPVAWRIQVNGNVNLCC